MGKGAHDGEDRAFARGNPFVRALGDAPLHLPDDEKAKSPIMYVLFGLLSLVLVALFVAALVLPPLFTHSLIVRGLRSGRPAMVAAGSALALVYFYVIFSAGKRLMGRPRPLADEVESDR